MERKKFKKTLILIGVIVLLFGIINVIWLSYLVACYIMPVKNNSDFNKFQDNNITSYQTTIISNEQQSTYDVTVFYPKYLQYSGNYCISQRLILNEENAGYTNKYLVSMAIKPKLFGENTYQFQITDFTDGEKRYHFELDEELVIQSYNGLSPEKLLENDEVFLIVTDEIEIAAEYFA